MSDWRDQKVPISEAFRLLGDYLADQDPGDVDAGWLRLKAAMDAEAREASTILRGPGGDRES